MKLDIASLTMQPFPPITRVLRFQVVEVDTFSQPTLLLQRHHNVKGPLSCEQHQLKLAVRSIQQVGNTCEWNGVGFGRQGVGDYQEENCLREQHGDAERHLLAAVGRQTELHERRDGDGEARHDQVLDVVGRLQCQQVVLHFASCPGCGAKRPGQLSTNGVSELERTDVACENIDGLLVRSPLLFQSFREVRSIDVKLVLCFNSVMTIFETELTTPLIF